MWREWRICLGEMEIWDGSGGVEEVFGWICGIIRCRTNCRKWRGAVWQQQTLWSVFVTIEQAGQRVSLSHFQVLIALCRQHLLSVLPLNTTQNLLSGCKLPRRWMRHVRSPWGLNCPVSAYSKGRTSGIFEKVRPVRWNPWFHPPPPKTARFMRSGYDCRKSHLIINLSQIQWYSQGCTNPRSQHDTVIYSLFCGGS